MGVIRLLFLAHRYLGIAVGLLMSMWCVSGLVMMYVSYPAIGEAQRTARLAPLTWDTCCRVPAGPLADIDTAHSFRIEMLAGHPVLELEEGPAGISRVDLTSGTMLIGVAPAQGRSVAQAYAGAHDLRLLGRVDCDQWTLEDISPEERPLYRFAVADPEHTQIYVSMQTGRAVQLTTRSQRFWNWLGPIPHWLYFAALRRHVMLWTQLIIYTSLVGCFLSIIGLYIGLWQLLRAPAGRCSPYRGFNLWHHLAGVLFGILTLSWVLSGLLSMNPWGWLQGGDDSAATLQLQGAGLAEAEVRAALQALARQDLPGIVSVRGANFQGRLYLIATTQDGAQRRLDAQAQPAPLGARERDFMSTTLSGPLTLLPRGDDYYFVHHSSQVRLPVYRILGADGVRYYVDPVSGALLASVDAGARGYRWWHQALHRMDFSAWVRERPQWDVLMWLLMSGVTLVCATGCYLGMRRIL
jgi:hypothetical protein